jgi:hypothetical protein
VQGHVGSVVSWQVVLAHSCVAVKVGVGSFAVRTDFLRSPSVLLTQVVHNLRVQVRSGEHGRDLWQGRTMQPRFKPLTATLRVLEVGKAWPRSAPMHCDTDTLAGIKKAQGASAGYADVKGGKRGLRWELSAPTRRQ